MHYCLNPSCSNTVPVAPLCSDQCGDDLFNLKLSYSEAKTKGEVTEDQKRLYELHWERMIDMEREADDKKEEEESRKAKTAASAEVVPCYWCDDPVPEDRDGELCSDYCEQQCRLEE